MNAGFPWFVATVLGLIAIWYQIVSWRLDKTVGQMTIRLQRQSASLAHAQRPADPNPTLVVGNSRKS